MNEPTLHVPTVHVDDKLARIVLGYKANGMLQTTQPPTIKIHHPGNGNIVLLATEYFLGSERVTMTLF